MNKFFTKIQQNHHKIFKVLLIIVAIGVIVFIFPREGKFKYEFQKGKPWIHETLIAPFDFAVAKTPQELDKEKEMIVDNKKLFFIKKPNVKEKSVVGFSDKMDMEYSRFFEKVSGMHDSISGKVDSSALKRKLKIVGVNILDSLYERGIIQLHSAVEGKTDDFVILLTKNNVAEDRMLGDFFTIQSAYGYINNKIAKLPKYQKDFLRALLEGFLQQNIVFDEVTTESALQAQLNKISLTTGMVQKGQKIVEQGELLNEDDYRIVNSLKREFESHTGSDTTLLKIMLGQIILVSLLFIALIRHLVVFKSPIVQSDVKISFILVLQIIFILASKAISGIENISIYLLPFCMIPLVVRTFFDHKTALYTYVISIIIISFIVDKPYEFILIELLAGMITILTVLNLKNRSQLFISSGLIFLVYAFTFFGLEIIKEGSFSAINYEFLAWYAGSALLTLFTYPIIYIFEKVFGFVSEITLMELADTNNKLLRKLNLKAPGTFQHSLQVSNLAEDGIREIGGDSLLVRTGALYHDIGKMNTPLYFIENQSTGINPHDDLMPDESAQIIIDHVINGIEIAKRFNLPDIIIDFIRTHHGTTKTRYFYSMYKKQNPDTEIDDSIFTYPGPIPYSKETAVLMMADSVEAASRSLKNYTGKSIETLVDSIIDQQIEEKQFVSSNITFRDISIIKKIFKRKLMSIYHVRVAYPE